MKPRHIYIQQAVRHQVAREAVACRSMAPPWERSFWKVEIPIRTKGEAKVPEPAQKPRVPSSRNIIFSSIDDIKIISSFRRPDFDQEEEPKRSIRVLTLQDLLRGEDWKVKEWEKMVQGDKALIALSWVAGAASATICLVDLASKAQAGASSSAIGVSIALLAGIAAVLIKVVKYFKKTKLQDEQELQKAREELNAKGEI